MEVVIDAGAADGHGGRVFDDAFFLGVAVEADDRAQLPGDRGTGTAGIFKVAGEALDVDPDGPPRPYSPGVLGCGSLRS